MRILRNGNCSRKNSRPVDHRKRYLSFGRHARGAFVSLALMVLLVAVSGSDANAAGVTLQAKIARQTLASGGRQHTYYLFVPASVTASTQAPLMLLLHGSGRNGVSLVEKWKDVAEREGIVLVGPDAIESIAWRSPVDGPAFLRDLVNAVASKQAIDSRRLYLFGHSAGAEFALRMSLLESEYFAATAIHAGALVAEEYGLTRYSTRKIPMTVIIGTRDPIFPLPLVRATVNALNKEGFDTRIVEIAGHDHNYYVRSNEINKIAWDFFKTRKLEKDAKYFDYR